MALGDEGNVDVAASGVDAAVITSVVVLRWCGDVKVITSVVVLRWCLCVGGGAVVADWLAVLLVVTRQCGSGPRYVRWCVHALLLDSPLTLTRTCNLRPRVCV